MTLVPEQCLNPHYSIVDGIKVERALIRLFTDLTVFRFTDQPIDDFIGDKWSFTLT